MLVSEVDSLGLETVMNLQLLPFCQGPHLAAVTIPHVSHQDVGSRKSMPLRGTSQYLTGVFGARRASVEALAVRAGRRRRYVLVGDQLQGRFS